MKLRFRTPQQNPSIRCFRQAITITPHVSLPLSEKFLMHSTRYTATAIVLLALSACTPVAEPPLVTLPTTSAALSDEGVVIQAMGAGTVDLTGGVGGPGDA